MKIDRVAVQQIIDTVPAKLRNAARAERKAIITESRKDPIGTSIRAAHGQFDFSSNVKLQKQISKLNDKIAADAYKSSHSTSFIQRQPMGEMAVANTVSAVHSPVHASMVF